MGLLLMSLGGSALAQSDEIVFWESVKDSKDGSEFCAYLESYPNGKFKALARLRAKKLGGECASGKLSREEKKDPPGKATLTASQVRAAWDACGKSSSENAEQACKSLLQSGGLDDKERVEIYVRLSVTYYHFHKWDDTIAVLTSAIEIDPDHAGHYASRAYAYRSAKKFRAAVVDMRKAAELDPKRYADLAREWAAKFGDSPASDGEKNRVSREDTEKASKSGLTGEAGGRTAKLSREEMEKIHWLQQYKEWKLLGIAGNEFKGSAKQLCWDCASIRFACQTGFITNYEKELPKLKIAVVDWPTSTGAWAWISKKTESAFKIPPEYASRYLKRGLVDCIAIGGGKLWYNEKTAADELEKLQKYLVSTDKRDDRSGGLLEGIVGCSLSDSPPKFLNGHFGGEKVVAIKSLSGSTLISDIKSSGKKNLQNINLLIWDVDITGFLQGFVDRKYFGMFIFYDRNIKFQHLKYGNYAMIGDMKDSHIIKTILSGYLGGDKLYCAHLMTRDTCPHPKYKEISVPCK